METVVRLLREGRVEGLAPLVVLVDSTQAVGGPALVRQAVRDLSAAIAAGRAAAGGVTVVALEQPAETYVSLCTSLPTGAVAVIDCHSNPYGWAKTEAASAALQLFTPSAGLPELERRLGRHAHPDDGPNSSAQPSQRCVIIDGGSQLVDAFGCSAVAEMLARLQRAPGVAALLCSLHADLHSPQAVAALQQNAAAVATVLPLTQLERDGARLVGDGSERWQPHGRLEVQVRRTRSGRVKVESKLFGVSASGEAHFRDVAPPALPAAMGPKAAAGDKPASAEALASQLAGGMRLELSAGERAAREGVRLPYEHQGQAARYATGDFRDFLPAEAGGKGGGAGRLGHILYVRDSDSEDADSDEDPDDDLDI